MKLKELNKDNMIYYSPAEINRYGWKRGWLMCLAGLPVYAFLRIIGKKPQEFYGYNNFFYIGKNWGGFNMGWLCVCCTDATERLQCHELGHRLANANVGGIQMALCGIGSALRYWYREIFHVTEPSYDAWWYENQATTCGRECIKRIKENLK